ncbi:MAG: SgcJ/EcaC family oxidoreductase [Vicinamibacteria bacterium]
MISKMVPWVVLVSLSIGCGPDSDLTEDAGSHEYEGAGGSPADEAAIRMLYDQILTGWNMGSGEAFAAPFAEDAVFVAFDGTRFLGRSEIASFHQKLFDEHLRDSRLQGRVNDVRFLDPEVAVVTAEGGTIMPGEEETLDARDSMQLMVVEKQQERWLIESFQNARTLTVGEQLFLDLYGSLPEDAQRRVGELVDSLVEEGAGDSESEPALER